MFVYYTTGMNSIQAVTYDSDSIFLLEYNDIGKKLQNFDYSNDSQLKEFSSCKISPSGEAIALGNFSKYLVFLYNGRKQVWEACIKNCENYFSGNSPFL